jgi:peptidoglycan/LPS O-acetylase OafA/YrhL
MPYLDGLRGVTIILVLWFHAGGLFRGGFIGVDIFFVLSGFLITSLLIKEYDENQRIYLGRFYMRRALRLLPALVVMLAAWGAFCLFFGEDTYKTWRDIGIVFFYAGNWARAYDLHLSHTLGHTWSLAIEEQFYILWPLIFIVLRYLGCSMRTLLFLTLGAAVVSTAVGGWWYYTGMAALDKAQLSSFGYRAARSQIVMRLYNGLDTHSSGLLVGCALAFFMSGYKPAIQARAKGIHAASLAAAVVLIIIAFTAKWSSGLMFAGGYLVVAIASAIIIASLCITENNPIRKVLEHKWIVYLGRISYGLYLWHYPIYYVVDIYLNTFNSPIRWPVKLTVGTAVALGVTYLSFRFIETPILSLKSHFQAPARTAKPAREPDQASS